MKPEVQLACILIASGLVVCALGWGVRYVGHRLIDADLDPALFDWARYLMAMGACVIFAGIGASAAVQVALVGVR